MVLADAGYGSSTDFRREIRKLGLHYAVGAQPQTAVLTVPERVDVDSVQISVKDLAMRLQGEGAFRRCTWREGTRETLSAKFVMRRVFASSDPRDEIWLVSVHGVPQGARPGGDRQVDRILI